MTVGMDRCESCGEPLTPGAFFLVRIDVLADPTPPDEPPGETYEQLIAQLQSVSADEAQDQVHRRFEYKVCPSCQLRILANPLGLPRVRRDAAN
ncbi:MAG: hypothetical protein AAGD32_15150 [Planctomycetota bacterium]